MSRPTPVTPDALRALVNAEADELGSEPVDALALAGWRNERRAAAVLQAAVAGSHRDAPGPQPGA